MLEIINSGWFSVLTGTTIGLAGIWLAVIFYKRAKQISRLRYLIGDAPLIGPTPTRFSDGLEIRFEGQPVPRVTSTSYGVWNDGTLTVHGRDIVETDPLRLEIPEDAQILRAALEAETRRVNGTTIIAVERNKVILGFDYLDPGDGFRIQVLHSGCPGSVQGNGTIRGLPQGILPPDDRRAFKWLMIGAIGLASLLYGFMVGVSVTFLGIKTVFDPWPRNLVSALLLALVLCAIILTGRWISKQGFAASQFRVKGIPSAISEDGTLVDRAL